MKGDRAIAGVVRREGVTVGTVLVASVAVIGMWGPWFASGSATRNSFGFFRAAQVLGIEWVTPFRVAWFLLPIVLAAALALVVFGARRSGLGLLLGLGAILAGAGWLSVSAFEARTGSTVAAAAGTGTVVAAGAALIASMTGRATVPGAGQVPPPAGSSPVSGEATKLSTEN